MANGRRILAFIFVVCKIACVSAACSDGIVEVIADLPSRDPSSRSNYSEDSILSDTHFNYKWYDAVYNGWQYLMVDSTEKPNYTDCSTYYPVYLQGTHPDVDTLTETPIDMIACRRDYSFPCYLQYPVKIRKCDQKVQYYLTPTNSYSAYCFEKHNQVEFLLPDPEDADLGNVEVSPELHFDTVIEENPFTKRNVTKYIPFFKMRCGFNIQRQYFYKVNWYMDGKLHNSTGPRRNDSEIMFLHENQLGKTFITHGFDIHCGVSVLAAVNQQETEMVYSKRYFVGIQVLNTTLYIKKGTTETLHIKSTMPIGCYYDDNKDFDSECKETFMIFSDEKYSDQCKGADIVNKGNFGSGQCSEGFKVLRLNEKWDPEKIYQISVVTTDITYDDKLVFSLKLEFSSRMGHAIWRNFLFPTVKVIVVENDEYKQKICYSHIDPHMRTSDGYYYEQQKENGKLNPGSFLLYRNKEYNIEVQEKTKTCNRNHATCACGIAIVAGQDVFMINRCGGLNYLDFIRCDDGGILDVVKLNDYLYNIYTPIGTKIVVRLFNSGYSESTMNIDITMAPKDFRNVEGLCGDFDNNITNDLRYRTGFVEPITAARTYGNHHDKFSKSWKLHDNENLFLTHKRELTGWTTKHGLYCLCKDSKAVCSKTQYINCTRGSSITKTKCTVTNRKRRDVHTRYTRELDRLYTLMNTDKKYPEEITNDRVKREDEAITISEEDADLLCTNKINQSLAVTSYGDVGGDEDPVAVIAQCAFDVVAGNDTSWATTHVESVNNIVKNMIEQEPTYAENNTEKVEIFMLNTCPGNCSNNGVCTKSGVCECKGFYHGPDCLIDERDPLIIDDIEGGGECDLADGGECICFHVRSSNVLEGFKCKSNTSKLKTDGSLEGLTSLSFLGGYEDIFTGVCCIQNIIGTENVFVAQYDISISNNGISYGNEKSVYVFDSTCQNNEVFLDGSRAFTMKPGHCFIGGYCVSETEMAPAGCLACQSSKDVYGWTAYNPCQNKGNCSDQEIGYRCFCVPGYGGKNCEFDIDECLSSPCQHSGNCTDLLNGYTCSCRDGFAGTNCEININECESNPCKNSGICKDSINSFTCSCRPGYEGTLCETEINECVPDPCQNNGTCLDVVNGYTCTCSAGFFGVNCSVNVDDCLTNPCLNGGTCLDQINSRKCTCIDGFSGPNCETNIDDCEQEPCLNAGSCEDFINGYSCTCVAGYIGTNCSKNINECASNPCQHGGSCVDGVNQYTCFCAAGYDGNSCETDINECISNPCQHDGSCTDGVNEFTCSCAAGYEGTNCETDIDECESDPCENGGSCTDGVNKYTCLCAAGYSGTDCENDINECEPDPCENGGSCTDAVNKYICACAAGYSGTNCENDIDECEPNPCENGGSCTDGVNKYICACTAGYSGTNCENDIDECEPNPCENGGSCTDGVNQYTCSCTAGYSGTNCENDIDECEPDPCENGGSCSDAVNKYICACAAGYSGTNCENDVDECEPNPCENGGSCTDGVNKYTCSCTAGYSGTNCENDIDECEPNPCENGGSCTDGVNKYTCLCAAGYSGTYCENDIDECEPNPCENGGSCTDGVNNYTCSCTAGYSGTNCENDIDECESDPCENGGSCTDGVNKYTCLCAAGYSGTNCENVKPTTVDLLPSTKVTVMKMVFNVSVAITSLNSPAFKDEIVKELTAVYRRRLYDRLKRVEVTSLSFGSLVVDYEVEFENSETASNDVFKTVIDLTSGKQVVNIMNESVSAVSVEINNSTVTKELITVSSALCEIYVAMNGKCSAKSQCSVVDGSPTCVLNEIKEKEDSKIIIIAASCSGGILLLAIFVVLFFVWKYKIRTFTHHVAKVSKENLGKTGLASTYSMSQLDETLDKNEKPGKSGSRKNEERLVETSALALEHNQGHDNSQNQSLQEQGHDNSQNQSSQDDKNTQNEHDERLIEGEKSGALEDDFSSLAEAGAECPDGLNPSKNEGVVSDNEELQILQKLSFSLGEENHEAILDVNGDVEDGQLNNLGQEHTSDDGKTNNRD